MRFLSMIIILISLLLFGFFVWPTRYSYESQNDRLYEKKFYRIDRLSGEVFRWDRTIASWEIYRFRGKKKGEKRK